MEMKRKRFHFDVAVSAKDVRSTSYQVLSFKRAKYIVLEKKYLTIEIPSKNFLSQRKESSVKDDE
jgi:hypothetical protein